MRRGLKPLLRAFLIRVQKPTILGKFLSDKLDIYLFLLRQNVTQFRFVGDRRTTADDNSEVLRVRSWSTSATCQRAGSCAPLSRVAATSTHIRSRVAVSLNHGPGGFCNHIDFPSHYQLISMQMQLPRIGTTPNMDGLKPVEKNAPLEDYTAIN